MPLPGNFLSDLNGAPSFFFRKGCSLRSPLRTIAGPPPQIEDNFDGGKPAIKTCPGYISNNMASYSDEKMVGFPNECLPIHNELLRHSTNNFTSSFVAGMYRDTRMGVAELREKRVGRLRKQQAVVAQAQASVARRVADLRARQILHKKRAKLKAEVMAARRNEAGIFLCCAKLIQKVVRGRLGRARARAKLKARLKAKLKAEQEAALALEKRRRNAAITIQKHYLRFVTSTLSKSMTSGKSSPRDQVKLGLVLTLLSKLESPLERFHTAVAVSPARRKLEDNQRAALKIQRAERWRSAVEKVQRRRVLRDFLRPHFEAWSEVRFLESPSSSSSSSSSSAAAAAAPVGGAEDMLGGIEGGEGRVGFVESGGKTVGADADAPQGGDQRWGETSSSSTTAGEGRRPSGGSRHSPTAEPEKRLSQGENDILGMVPLLKEKARLAKAEAEESAAHEEQVQRERAFQLKLAAAAVVLQGTVRACLARREVTLRKRELAVEKVRMARAMLRRLPQECPDREAPVLWLADDDARGRRFGLGPGRVGGGGPPPAGAVDLSRTARRAFWLDTDGDLVPTEKSALRGSRGPNARSSRAHLGGSVRSTTGGGDTAISFPSAFISSSSMANPIRGFRL